MSKPYRDDRTALEERRASLERELARVRAEVDALEKLRTEESRIARELGAIDARLAGGSSTSTDGPSIDDVRVASPCGVSWDDMAGDDRVRFCLECKKQVFNLSAMTREEGDALVARMATDPVCVRFYRRADGTMITADCPVGVKKKRRRLALFAAAGAAAMTAGSFASGGHDCPSGRGVATQGLGEVGGGTTQVADETLLQPIAADRSRAAVPAASDLEARRRRVEAAVPPAFTAAVPPAPPGSGEVPLRGPHLPRK